MENTKEYLNFYNSGNMVFYKSMRLFAMEKDSNWNLYIDKEGTLYYIAKFGSGANSGIFGDCLHVRNLLKQGHAKNYILTAYGRQLMSEKAGFATN